MKNILMIACAFLLGVAVGAGAVYVLMPSTSADTYQEGMPALDGGMPQGMEGEMPQGMEGERPEGMEGERPEGMTGERPEAMEGERPEGMTPMGNQ